MGMTLGFIEVTPEQLDGVMDDGRLAEELYDELSDDATVRDGFIEKAWDGIQYLLDEAGVGVELRMDGDPIEHDDDELHIADGDLYLLEVYRWLAFVQESLIDTLEIHSS